MRIVGGRLRGRRLEAPAGLETRPTSDRLRETLFNILLHHDWGAAALENGRALDAFCGSGALALEALSRGAACAVLMDVAAAALTCARGNIATLGEGANATVLRADAGKPPKAERPCSLILLDPPYGKDLATKALAALDKAGWCALSAVAVVEEGEAAPFSAGEGWELLEERRNRGTVLRFLQKTAS
jgi:16S rRNA (guanine966-N2)-methyltransferase